MTIPFTTPNDRIFYACVGVLVGPELVGRNDIDQMADPQDHKYLTGVTSVGVNGDMPSTSLLDIGRFQRKFHYYGQQTFEITIERNIDHNSQFFYYVDPSDYGTYTTSHVLHANNMHSQGYEDNNGKCLRSYDITILYGGDDTSRLGSGTNVYSITYQNCVVTGISYSISVGGTLTESVTLTTKHVKNNNAAGDTLTASYGDLPGSAQSGDMVKWADFRPMLESTTAAGLRAYWPDEVISLFYLANTEGGLSVLGVQSIDIDMTIEYSEPADVGIWRGGDKSTGMFQPKELHKWKTIVTPVQVTASFTGITRQPFYDIGLSRGGTVEGSDQALANVDFTFGQPDTSPDTLYQEPASAPYDKYARTDRIIKMAAEKYPSGIKTFFVIDLGQKNYLTSMSFSGGDTGGGTQEATLSYQNDWSDIVLAKDTTIQTVTNNGPY